MKRLIIIVFALCFLFTGDLFAQEKGMIIAGKASSELSGVIYRKGWALIIGINKYPNVPPLDYAVADANAVAELIKRKFGFDEKNITLLKDAQATKQGIMDALAELTDKESVGENDCVLIYFSGHGQTVPLPESGGGGDMGYLVPYDAKIDLSKASNIAQYEKYCIGMDELSKKGSQITAKHVIFIVDACYSGLVIEGKRGLDPQIPGYIKKIAKASVRQIITAGGKEDKSSEFPALGHGLFTYKLLEGLDKGIADTNDDEIITGFELGNYLRGVVPSMDKSDQTPQFRTKGEGEFMFLPQIISTDPVKEPSSSSFSISDLKTESEKQANMEKVKLSWANKLGDMKKAFNEVKDFETESGTSILKFNAWQRFLDSFKEDNPYSQEDDTMRQEASKQMNYWENQPSEIKPQIIPGTKTIIGKDGAEMVLIPAGEFQMGSNESDDEKPIHTVYLDAFYIDKYEVTNAQYKKFMDATGQKAPPNWNNSGYNATNQPVVGVTWNDAKAYADWAGERLPTEAEWEKSARGGLVGKKYPWGDTLTYDDANYSGTGGKDIWSITSPVGSFAPNGYGLYDMAGNAWEWCADWYGNNYYGSSPKSNPTGPASGSYRVLRGGSWNDSDDRDLRTASRGYLAPSRPYFKLGFRCAGLR
jgi:sulfatase modifying factor 1